jgi:hypothetical protein
MADYRVSVDIDLGAFQQEVLGQLFPIVTQAIASVAELGANQWRDAVMKARIAPFEKSAYADSIQWKMTGGFSAEIWADYKLAGEIETGRPARDLKQYLRTSRRTRISNSKKHPGQKYLIIPFRHNTPGYSAHSRPMPNLIHHAAKQLSKSSVVGSGIRISGTGHPVSQSIYNWGGRLPAGMLPKAKPHHVTDLYAGMVRMNTSAGGGKSSAYLTFRVMGEWSIGWVVPAKPGLYLAREVSTGLQPVLEEALAKAVSLSK